MDLKTFIRTASAKYPKYTPRQKRLCALRLALYGGIYDDRTYDFSQETEDSYSNERIPLDKRRPAVQYTLPAIAVRDQITMLFGEEHRPNVIVRDDDNTNDWIAAFIQDTNFWWYMTHLATEGSPGTGIIVARVLGPDDKDKPGRFYLEVWPAEECQPTFRRESPNDLKKLVRTYYVSEDSLLADGYDVEALKRKWINKDGRTKSAKSAAAAETAAILSGNASLPWVMRIALDEQFETRYEPIPKWIYEAADFAESSWPEGDRSSNHKLGEVPALWIRNAPASADLYPDGDCLWKAAVDFQLRIDKTMSQAGRAFDYCGDPQFFRIQKDGVSAEFGEEADMDATASAVLSGEDAKFVEIRGEGLKVAVETYVSRLNHLARTASGASRIDPETVHQGVLTGAAMKMLNAELLQCVGILRMSYGDGGIVRLLKLCMRIAEKVNVELPSLKEILARRQREDQRRQQVKQTVAKAGKELADPTVGCGGGCGCCDNCMDGCQGDCCDDCGAKGKEYTGKPNPGCLVELNWPAYYEPTGQDFAQQIAGTAQAVEAKLISQETGVSNTAALFDVQDATKEMDRIQDQTAIERAQGQTDAKNEAEAAEKAKAKNAVPA